MISNLLVNSIWDAVLLFLPRRWTRALLGKAHLLVRFTWLTASETWDYTSIGNLKLNPIQSSNQTSRQRGNWLMALIRWQPSRKLKPYVKWIICLMNLSAVNGSRQRAGNQRLSYKTLKIIWCCGRDLVDGRHWYPLTREAVAISGEHRLRRRPKRKASSAPSSTAISSVWSPASADPNEQVKAEFKNGSPDVDAAQGNGSSSHSRQTQPRR